MLDTYSRNTTSEEYCSAVTLIGKFQDLDKRLKSAIDKNDWNEIRLHEVRINEVLDQLLSRDFRTRDERQQAMRFLVDHFILHEQASQGLSSRVCNRLLDLVA